MKSIVEYKHYGIILCPSIYGTTVNHQYVLHMMEYTHTGGSSNGVRGIKSTTRWVGHVASNGARRNVHRVPVTKSDEKSAYNTLAQMVGK
jgi:hypothetical protein